MDLTTDELRSLARATVSGRPGERERAISSLGGPGDAALTAAALAHLDDPDRNVRVAALRVLARSDSPEAVTGILRGLDDPKKRVREVAAKSSVRFVDDPRVVARLKQAVDRNETGSARPALEILGGVFASPFGLEAIAPVPEALASLLAIPRYRRFVLVSLLRSRRLDTHVEAMLRDFVVNGSKEEAVLATRRLCGFRVEHDARISDEARKWAERAWGDAFFWVRSDVDS